MIRAHEVSVRRLRELVRNIVFTAAADQLPDALESDLVAPFLEEELAFHPEDRDVLDLEELADEFEMVVGRARLREIAEQHHVSLRALNALSRAVQTVIDEMHDRPRSYRNVTERTQRLAKVALWLVSGANTQAEFRRYFGSRDADMPTKSVAHQLYHEIFKKEGGQ